MPDPVKTLVKKLNELMLEAMKSRDSKVSGAQKDTYIDAVIKQDLTDELVSLKKLSRSKNIEEMKEQFTALCQARAARNQGTLLHFDANPHSICNTLYFDIANLLYPQASFIQLFQILLPHITTLLHFDLHDKRIFELLATTVNDPINPMASMPAKLDSFKQLVMYNNCVFPLSEIAGFNFSKHQIHLLYKALSSNAETLQLLHALEQHNPEIGALLAGAASTPVSPLGALLAGAASTPVSPLSSVEKKIINLNRQVDRTILPAVSIQKIFQQIVINDIGELLTQLNSVSPDLYYLLLPAVTINFDLPKELYKIWEDQLNDTQRQTILTVMLKEQSKFGAANLLATFVTLGADDEIASLLEPLSSEEAFAILQENDCRALYWAAKINPIAIRIMLNKLPKPQCIELIQKRLPGKASPLMAAALYYTQCFNEILSKLYQSQEEKIAALKSIDLASGGTTTIGNTILLYAVSNPDSVALILSLYPESERSKVLLEPNKDGLNAITSIINNAEINYEEMNYEEMGKIADCMIAALTSLPENERLPVLETAVTSDGKNILHLIAQNPLVLEKLLVLLTVVKRQEALLTKIGGVNSGGPTVLQLAAENPESMVVIDELCPPAHAAPNEERASLMEIIGETRKNIARHPPKTRLTNFDLLADAVYQQELTDEMQKLRQMANLASIADKREQFSTLCRIRAQKNTGTALEFKNNPTNPFTEICNQLYIRISGKLYPEASHEELLNILAVTNSGSDSDIDSNILPTELAHFFYERIVINDIDSLISFLINIPPEDYAHLFQKAAINPVIYKDIEKAFEELFEADSQALLDVIIQSNLMMQPDIKIDVAKLLTLFIQRKENELVKRLLEPLSADKVFALVQEKVYTETQEEPSAASGKTYTTPLILAAKHNATSLAVLINSLPENLRLPIIKSKGTDGETILHYAISNPKSIPVVLGVYPENERYAALLAEDNYGLSAISDVITSVEEDVAMGAGNNINIYCMIAALNSLPMENERKDLILAAVDERDDKNILHLLVDDPRNLKKILKLLPEKDRIPTLLSTDGKGNSVLDLARYNRESMAVIEKLCLEDDAINTPSTTTPSTTTPSTTTSSNPYTIFYANHADKNHTDHTEDIDDQDDTNEQDSTDEHNGNEPGPSSNKKT